MTQKNVVDAIPEPNIIRQRMAALTRERELLRAILSSSFADFGA